MPQPQLADLAPSLAASLPSPPTLLSLAALAAPSAAQPGSAYPSGLSNDLATTGSRLQPCVMQPQHHARTQAHSMDVIFDEIKGAQRSPPSGRLYPHGLYASQWLRPAPCSPRVKAPQRSSGRVLGDVPVNGALGGVR